MIKKEYIQPEVKAVELKRNVLLTTISGGDAPQIDTDDPGFDDEDDI